MKMVKLQDEVHEKLMNYTNKGETFSEAINRLLDDAIDDDYDGGDPAGMVEQINWERDHPECMARLPIDDDFRNALIRDRSPRATAVIFEIYYHKNPEYHARLKKYYIGKDDGALTLDESNTIKEHIKYNQKWYDRLERYNREHPSS